MSNLATAIVVTLGLAFAAYGIAAHGTTILRALAIALGVILFLIGLAFHDDPREDHRRWR